MNYGTSSIGSTNPNTLTYGTSGYGSSSNSGSTSLAVAGLASGFDWQSLISQLIAVEQIPEQRLRAQQSQIQQVNATYGGVSSQLSALQTDIQALNDPTLYTSRQTSSSDTTSATATAASGATLGNYAFAFSQLATAAVQQGTTAAIGGLSPTNDVSSLVATSAPFVTPVTAGTFTVNGQQVTIGATDTLQTVFNDISTATGGAVTASYSASADKITLSSASPIVLGSGTDTSNFLQVAQLYNNGTGTITSAAALGQAQLGVSLASANLTTPISDGGSGAGQFLINGVAISFNASTDTVNTILGRINTANAGVTASYDSINRRFLLTNQNTGDAGISLKDVTGNFLAATGLSGGTLQRGNNLLYTVNGGPQLVSQSNTITAASSGVTGLSVTALKQGGSSTISVTANTGAVQTAITNFVNQYNKVQSLIDAQTATSTDASGNLVPGLLTGDSDAYAITDKLRTLTDTSWTTSNGSVLSLDALGVVANGNNNTLSLGDGTALTAALTNNMSGVQQLFTDSTNGIAVQMNSFLNDTIGVNGTLVAKQGDLTQQSNGIDTQVANMDRLIQNDKQRMTNEFVAMETAQSQINQQLAYLQQNGL